MAAEEDPNARLTGVLEQLQKIAGGTGGQILGPWVLRSTAETELKLIEY